MTPHLTVARCIPLRCSWRLLESNGGRPRRLFIGGTRNAIPIHGCAAHGRRRRVMPPRSTANTVRRLDQFDQRYRSKWYGRPATTLRAVQRACTHQQQHFMFSECIVAGGARMQGVYRYPPGRKWRYGQATRCCCCWLLHGGAHERKDTAAKHHQWPRRVPNSTLVRGDRQGFPSVRIAPRPHASMFTCDVLIIHGHQRRYAGQCTALAAMNGQHSRQAAANAPSAATIEGGKRDFLASLPTPPAALDIGGLT